MATGLNAQQTEEQTKGIKRLWLTTHNQENELQDLYQKHISKKQRTTAAGTCIQWVAKKFCYSARTDKMTVGFDTMGLGSNRSKFEEGMCDGVGAQCRKVNGEPYGYTWKKGESFAVNPSNCAVDQIPAQDLPDGVKQEILKYGGMKLPDVIPNNRQADNNDWCKWEQCNCWLCGLPLCFADALGEKGTWDNDIKMKPECEHKLPILFLIMYGAGPATKINATGEFVSDASDFPGFNTTVIEVVESSDTDRRLVREHTRPLAKSAEFIKWKWGVRGWSYAWSHRVCNKIKSAMCFLSLTVNNVDVNGAMKDRLEYTILEDMIEKYANIITRKKPTNTQLHSGLKYGIWTNKQGDWKTIHRRAFYNFDSTESDYEPHFDGLQVWNKEGHPIYYLVNSATTNSKKKSIIKNWLNDKQNGWRNTVIYNLKQSLIPLTVELNKGIGGAEIYSVPSQKAIINNIWLNKYRLEYYIRKIFNKSSGLTIEHKKYAEWEKVKSSYLVMRQCILENGDITDTLEELKEYFNSIFIQEEGFEQQSGGCFPWEKCFGKRKKSEKGSDLEKQALLSLSPIRKKPPGSPWSSPGLRKQAQSQEEEEDDDYDEFIDVNIINMSNIMGTLIAGNSDFVGFNWETIGENSVKKALRKMVLDRRIVVLPKKIKDEDIKHIEQLDIGLNKVLNDDKFFDGELRMDITQDADNEGTDAESLNISGNMDKSTWSSLNISSFTGDGKVPSSSDNVQGANIGKSPAEMVDLIEDEFNMAQLNNLIKELPSLLSKGGANSQITKEYAQQYLNVLLQKGIKEVNMIESILLNEEKTNMGKAYEDKMFNKEHNQEIDNAIEILQNVWRRRKHTQEQRRADIDTAAVKKAFEGHTPEVFKKGQGGKGKTKKRRRKSRKKTRKKSRKKKRKKTRKKKRKKTRKRK
uniref:Uncharacterized protein n=1 Tax=viral metagenome TaxID=1070528 RepID=A0A6C0C1A6_9ZZZZ